MNCVCGCGRPQQVGDMCFLCNAEHSQRIAENSRKVQALLTAAKEQIRFQKNPYYEFDDWTILEKGDFDFCLVFQ